MGSWGEDLGCKSLGFMGIRVEGFGLGVYALRVAGLLFLACASTVGPTHALAS